MAAVLALNSAPAAAGGWNGYGYNANCACAPFSYSYAPRSCSYGYAPAYYYGSRGYYGRTVYRPGIARPAAWRAGGRWR